MRRGSRELAGPLFLHLSQHTWDSERKGLALRAANPGSQAWCDHSLAKDMSHHLSRICGG